jgi:hypothetical protein
VTAGRADLIIDAGAGYPTSFTLCEPTAVQGVPGAPVNIAGWHAKLAVRSSYGDGIAVELDDGALGGISVGTTNGKFSIAFTAAQTSLLPGQGVYDLLVTPPGGEPIRLVYGKITATPAVTP